MLDVNRKRNLFCSECFLPIDSPGLIGVRPRARACLGMYGSVSAIDSANHQRCEQNKRACELQCRCVCQLTPKCQNSGIHNPRQRCDEQPTVWQYHQPCEVRNWKSAHRVSHLFMAGAAHNKPERSFLNFLARTLGAGCLTLSSLNCRRRPGSAEFQFKLSAAFHPPSRTGRGKAISAPPGFAPCYYRLLTNQSSPRPS